MYLDDGGEFLKMSASVLPAELDTSNIDEPEVKDRPKVTGTKRSIILAICKKVPESHHNIKAFFEVTCLSDIQYTFHADLKLLLCALGN